MCTVLLRLSADPGAPWPVIVAAVRDEFVDRAWDTPGLHWPGSAPGVVGGRDRTAGGTWLAVHPRQPAVAALLNGVRLPPPVHGQRPSRGGLPLAALTGGAPFDAEVNLNARDLAGYDGFHLLLATPTSATVWTWDGIEVVRTGLSAGDHIIVNDGVDTPVDPLVPHFQPLLKNTTSPDGSWRDWEELLRGDGLSGDDERALIVKREFSGRFYGSTSASLIGLRSDGAARFAFTATPADPSWYQVPLAS